VRAAEISGRQAVVADPCSEKAFRTGTTGSGRVGRDVLAQGEKLSKHVVVPTEAVGGEDRFVELGVQFAQLALAGLAERVVLLRLRSKIT
jgi:hypothetical protein